MGHIQPCGALLAVHTSHNRIVYCSANSADVLGMQPEDLLGRDAESLFSSRWPEMLQLALKTGMLLLPTGIFPVPLNVVAHQQDDHLIFEFEVASGTTSHWWNYSKRIVFLAELEEARTLDQCRNLLVRWMFNRSGFDRVLLYEFFPDMHGAVVQEMRQPGIESYLGLHFPASDISPAAHRLYTINRQRIISDVNSPDVPLLALESDALPLDLTGSMLRAVHPVHIQYMKNMGVHASFSVSVIVAGKLYGLVACHHKSPRTLALRDRLAFEEMSRILSIHLETRLDLLEGDTRAALRQQLSRLKGALSTSRKDIAGGVSLHLPLIRELLSASGAWLRYDGHDYVSGDIPDKNELEQLGDWFKTLPVGEISSCQTLPSSLLSCPKLASRACGVLFIPLGDQGFVALLRPEIIKTISWAGKPQQIDQPDGDLEPKSPRSSFATWVQQTRFNSEPWTAAQKEFGAKLQADLLDFFSRAHVEKMALKMALYDPLTGLANRELFDQRLQEAMDLFLFNGSPFAIHMLDLDLFKPINDTLGHAAGDQVLQEVGRRLLKLARRDDTVARLGGDEFAIIQASLSNDKGAIILGEKVVQTITQPYDLDGKPVAIGVSAGIATCPEDSVNATELTQLADTALYNAKRSGRNRFCRYIPGMKLR